LKDFLVILNDFERSDQEAFWFLRANTNQPNTHEYYFLGSLRSKSEKNLIQNLTKIERNSCDFE